MSEQQTENNTPDAISSPEPAKGSKKLIIIVLAVIVLLGVGGGAGFYFTRSSGAESENAVASEKKSKQSSDIEEDVPEEDVTPKTSSKSAKSLRSALPNDEDVTQIIELQPYIVNLADADQARYLRMSVSLGIAGEAAEASPLLITRVRNAMLAILSDKESSEILSMEGKAKLRKDLLRAAQAAVDEPEIHAIYITDFIVQL